MVLIRFYTPNMYVQSDQCRGYDGLKGIPSFFKKMIRNKI